MSKIQSFNFEPGQTISKKFKILRKLGEGYESEVYYVEEMMTGIERAAKFFFPHRNIKNKTAKLYAKKLHKLHDCNILIKYLTQDVFIHKRIPITFLISEYVEGETLDLFLQKQKGKKLTPYIATRLLYDLTCGIEEIHRNFEYHGDLHTGNVMVQSFGLTFKLKVLDMFHWGDATRDNMREDLYNLIRIYYDALGGKKSYASLPQETKDICLGLKRTLILKKFRSTRGLKIHLEKLHWNR